MSRNYAPILWFFTIFSLFLSGCFDKEKDSARANKGKQITRLSHEVSIVLDPPRYQPSPPYPWEEGLVGNLPKITKEYFRCNGSLLNPEKMIERNGQLERITDCGGAEKHSLPLKDGLEFVQPILISLMNHIQAETGKKVVITSGHRCPEHNQYVDSSKSNLYSKHQVGAEVSFYVKGLEESPERVVQLLMDYYKNHQDEDFRQFQRYEKDDTGVITKPWYNKEIYIKLFKQNEGRNFDNRHPFPYIAVQVRYDPDSKERVIYSWDKAYKNYLRF